MTGGLDPRAAKAVALLRDYFFARTDKVAIVAPWGKPCPIEPIDPLDAMLAAHVCGPPAPKAKFRFRHRKGYGVSSGHPRVGSYVPGPDETTPWLCLDFDGKGHADALEDPVAAMLAAKWKCDAAQVPAYIERSGGGHGWHLWLFFETGVSAADARELGLSLAPEGFICVNGRSADARSARGIEVFPKQAKLKKKGFGNLVWLPFWHGAPEGANKFHKVDDAGVLQPCLPESFARLGPEAVKEALAKLKEGRRPEVAHQRKTEADIEVPVEPTVSSLQSPAWLEWRKQALAKLQLEAIYGEWLTGQRSGDGWLQCRDPESSTGDRDPSAGVADGTGEAERGAFHSFRTGETISVFDFLVRRELAVNFRSAVDRVAELTGVALPESTPAPPAPRTPSLKATGGRGKTSRPSIQINLRPLRDVISDAWSALLASNQPPVFFVRAGALARLAATGSAPRIELVDEAAMFGRLARIADWVRVSQEAEVDVSPLKDVARDMVVYPHPQLPVLESVVTSPVFDASGSLVSSAGFHAGARLHFHQPNGFSLVPVPQSPGAGDLSAARSLLLDELLTDFPFAEASDRAHAVAALLLPFVRRMIGGPTPLHLIEAPAPGTGKSLLAEAIATIATGHSGQPMNLGHDEEENRKRITAALSRAQSVVFIDNIRDGIDSAVLSMALTSTIYSDRLLGQTRMLDLPNQALWLATANNPRLSLEIARRCVRVRLDPRCDRPWQRRSFKHERLMAWVQERRADLVHAALVLVQTWLAAGRPPSERSIGSYESWAEILGGIMAVAGIEGFLTNLEELYELADAEGQEWRGFVAAWAEEYGTEPVTAGALLNLAIEHELLCNVIGDKSVRSQSIRLGKALLAIRDRQFDRHRVHCAWSTQKRQQLWQLADVEQTSAQHPHLQPLENTGVADVADVADVILFCGEKDDGDPRSHIHPHAYIKREGHPQHPPHPRIVDITRENPCGCSADVISTSANSNPDAVDLADLPSDDEEGKP